MPDGPVLHLPSVVDEALLDATRIGMLAEQVSLPLEPWQQRVIDLACIVDRTGADGDGVAGMIRTHLRTSRKRVSMRATNSRRPTRRRPAGTGVFHVEQTWGTSTLKPVENSDGE